ncbi:MAG: hypothetical protein K2N23_08270 [Clostridia bacterium]|nr:hypothetical protein [Clostridia bacterium]
MKEREFLEALDATMHVTLNGDGGDIDIDPVMGIKITKNKFVRVSCYVTYGDETKKFKNDKKLLKYLESAGAYENGEVNVKGIGEDKMTVEEYEAMLEFDKLDMAGLLEKYLPLADSFSLTCAYGENRISEELAAEALKKVKEKSFKMAETEFMGVSEEERKKLPPFKEIYADIENEYKNYCRQNSTLIEANDGYACFTDVFSGDRIYSSLDELWHAYSAVDFTGTCAYILDKLKKAETTRPLTEELDTEENKCLKDNLINTEVTFCWHCTQSSELSKVFYIKLNEDTVNWLKQFVSDYDLNLLEDLAFYKKGKLLFSSCTHERFHTDYSEDKN